MSNTDKEEYDAFGVQSCRRMRDRHRDFERACAACRLIKANLLALSSACVLFGVACVSSAHAQTELKLAHVGEPTSLLALSSAEFAKRTQAKLAGKIRVSVHGSSALGSDKEVLQKLKAGTVEMALSSALMSAEVELFAIFEMPYLVKDRAHMAQIEKEIFWPKLAPEAEKKGLRVIAVWESGFRHITNNKRAVRLPAHLEGLRLRVPDSKWRTKMFQAYGAVPVPMKFAEVFAGLQSGLVDGQENPLTQIHSARFQEVQKFLSLSGHVYTPAYLVVGAKKWATLPAAERRAIEDIARETQAYVHEIAQREDSELLDKLKAQGMQINTVDKAAFAAASKSVYEQFSKEVPGSKELIEKALALVQKQ